VSLSELKQFIQNKNQNLELNLKKYEKSYEKLTSEEKGELTPKRFNGSLKLLFPGTFYMKGGMEVVRAYERLRKTYGNTSLTIVTALHMLRKEDIEYMRSLPGLSLRDAKLDEKQMAEMYQSHDILLLPTYREGFGLVLVEALSYSMPLVATDQYATTEMAKDGLNGFTYPNPLRDYDSKTYQMFGKYYNPNIFYSKLFSLQDSGGLKAVEDFLYNSIERYLNDPDLLEKHSKGSIELYKKTFEMNMLSEQIDTVFLESIRKH
jgi:glycosyltransferase involved in cell wall biosynthesis